MKMMSSFLIACAVLAIGCDGGKNTKISDWRHAGREFLMESVGEEKDEKFQHFGKALDNTVNSGRDISVEEVRSFLGEEGYGESNQGNVTVLSFQVYPDNSGFIYWGTLTFLDGRFLTWGIQINS